MTRLALLGSIFLTPMVMEPLAASLTARGHDVVVVVPQTVGTASEVSDAYVRGVSGKPGAVVIAHSNAGNYVPAIAARVGVAGAVFADAVLPPLGGGRWPVMPISLAESLRGELENGLLPRWTRWWAAAEMRSLFPSAQSFAEADALTPRVPAAYLDETASAPAGWSSGLPCAYVAFGASYAGETQRAEAAGWPVRRLELGHLGMLTDPELVAEAVEDLLHEMQRA